MATPNPDRERRTLPATPQRRQDFRRRGVLPRSPETGPAIALGGALLAVLLLSGDAPTLVQTFAAAVLASGSTAVLTPAGAVSAMAALGLVAARILLPVAAAMWATVVFVLVATQGVSFNFAPGGLGRLNPLAGLQRMASRQALSQLGLSVAKLVLALAVGAAVVLGPVEAWANHPVADLATSLGAFHAALTELAAGLAAVALVIGAVAAVLARRRWEAEMRMTPEEMREEMRRNDGDPQLRRRRQGVHRRYTRQRLVEAVRGADVVITNPTHVAVALLYKPGTIRSPEVVAKGAEAVAARIRVEARLAGVPVVENRPLARALFTGVEIGTEVPQALFVAVAEVLAYVYRRRGYLPRSGGGRR